MLAHDRPGAPWLRRVRKRRVVIGLGLVLILLGAIGIVGLSANPASAAPGFQMPFPCGDGWLATTYTNHGGTGNNNPLDWNLSGDADAGKDVKAGVSGTVVNPLPAFQNPGYGNYVDVVVSGTTGWVTRYAHLASVSVTAAQDVTPQTKIGTVGTTGISPAANHLHYEQRINGAASAVVFNGVAVDYSITTNPDLWSFPGKSYTSANCDDYSNETILNKNPGGTLAVMAGGAKFIFGSMPEFTSLGYSTSPNTLIEIAAATFDGITTVPKNRTTLQGGGGQVYVVAGGAKFYFTDMGVYYAFGYTDAQRVKVPQAPLNAIGDAPGNKPKNKTLLADYYDNKYVMAGGVRFQASSNAELTSLGYDWANVLVRVPEGPLYQLGSAPSTVPVEDTLLKGTAASGDVFVVKSGVLRRFVSAQQITDLGYSAANIVMVPQSPLDGLPHGADLP